MKRTNKDGAKMNFRNDTVSRKMKRESGLEGGVSALIGPPGCGKTTTVARMCREIIHDGGVPMICSLTKSAASEAAGRDIPIDQDLIGTLHSHTYRALGNPTLVDDRNVSDWNDLNPLYELSEKSFSGDDPSESRGALSTYGDECFSELNLLRAMCIDRDNWPSRVSSFEKRWREWKDGNGFMDFADLIETASTHCSVAPGSPTHLIVDECQDMSKAELNLLRKWARKAQALIIVGDPYQALYVWRGAFPDMFWNVPDDRRQVLSQSYRIPQEVHRASMRWIETLSDYHPIEYHPTDETGLVRGIDANWAYPSNLLPLIENDLEEGRDIMIQASCDYMVAPTVKMLREEGIPFSNPWRTRRGDWNPLARRKGTTTRDRLESFMNPLLERRPWTAKDLNDWADITRANGLFIRGAKKQIQQSAKESPYRPVTVEDIRNWIEVQAIGEIMSLEDPERMIEWWRSRVKPEKERMIGFMGDVIQKCGMDGLRNDPRVYVGTIHSFKGAEAHTTITFPDLSKAGWDEWEDDPDSIIRLGYVALTRTKERAYICQPSGNSYMPIEEVAA